MTHPRRAWARELQQGLHMATQYRPTNSLDPSPTSGGEASPIRRSSLSATPVPIPRSTPPTDTASLSATAHASSLCHCRHSSDLSTTSGSVREHRPSVASRAPVYHVGGARRRALPPRLDAAPNSLAHLSGPNGQHHDEVILTPSIPPEFSSASDAIERGQLVGEQYFMAARRRLEPK
jgi:hypothetical protein